MGKAAGTRLELFFLLFQFSRGKRFARLCLNFGALRDTVGLIATHYFWAMIGTFPDR